MRDDSLPGATATMGSDAMDSLNTASEISGAKPIPNGHQDDADELVSNGVDEKKEGQGNTGGGHSQRLNAAAADRPLSGGGNRDTYASAVRKGSAGPPTLSHRQPSRRQRRANDAALAQDETEEPLAAIHADEYQEKDRDNSGVVRTGIRFAPWNVPLKRRLQTLAIFMHCLSITAFVSFFFFLCAIPLSWPFVLPYLIHILFSTTAVDGKLRHRSERFRSLPVWKLFAGYFPARLHKTKNLPPTRKYIFGYHPHGIISHGAWAAFATEALGFAEKFPGITNSLLTLDSNFRIPLYRDYILAMGLRSVSKDSIGNILTRGGPNNEGMGRAVTIVIGGARESLEAQPKTHRFILNQRRGFIKLALRTGADLVPVLAFGENDLYDQVRPEGHPWVHRTQMFILRVWKFTLPFLHGRGIFNYDVGLMPYRRPLNIVVGAPIKVDQATRGVVDAAEVDRLHGLYVKELRKIWDTYKDVFAPDRKEDMQFLD